METLYSRKQLDSLLDNYRNNLEQIWNLRSDEIYMRWKDETGDFEAIRMALVAFQPESLLEIGYGYGRLAPLYHDISLVTGMDICSKMLCLAARDQKRQSGIQLVCGDIRQLPFNNAFFDGIISVRTLNHVHPEDLSSVEEEISRVCRRIFLSLESDVKVKDARYEFEHDYDHFLETDFSMIEKEPMQPSVFLRTYMRKMVI